MFKSSEYTRQRHASRVAVLVKLGLYSNGNYIMSVTMTRETSLAGAEIEEGEFLPVTQLILYMYTTGRVRDCLYLPSLRDRVRMLARRLNNANDPYRDPVRTDSPPPPRRSLLPLHACGRENLCHGKKPPYRHFTACSVVANQRIYLVLSVKISLN